MVHYSQRYSGGCPYPVWMLVLGLLLAAATGCTRAFYRNRADCEVYGLVERGNAETCGDLYDYSIRPSSESRMYDPDCPDRPPMPPDDPTSHRLMRCVDCKQGWPCWSCNGYTQSVENPDWKYYLPYNDSGQVVLSREGAVELALVQSREYQRELEDLYLSALDVTLERFRFDTQFFGGNSTFFTSDGPLRAGSDQSLLETDTDFQMTKLFATGGELVVGMANSLVWQLAGPDEYSANTLLDFSLMQPLLRAGGRAVVLESLTDSERALLANVRQMERFRRGFYTQIVAGGGALAGPSRGRFGFGSVSTDTVRSAGGFLEILSQQVQIRNQESNVVGLRSSLERLEAFYEAGKVSGQQVGQTRQGLYGAQSQLLELNADYQRRLDAYKIQLGLPPDLDVRIEDELLARFDLIDPSLTATQDAVAQLESRLREDLGPLQGPAESPDIDPKQDYWDSLSAVRQDAAAQLEAVRGDLQKLRDALPERRSSLQRLATREEVRRGDIEPTVCSIDGLYLRVADLTWELEGIEPARELAAQLGVTLVEDESRRDEPPVAEQLDATLAELDSLQQGVEAEPQAGTSARKASLEDLIELVDRLSAELLQLSLIQARARLDTVTLVPVEMNAPEAFKTARANRRDWMNARATLVDIWRQIEVTANDLESDLDVTFSGDISTTDNNPVRFRDSTGRLRVGLEFDAPLTRLAERNAYRESLINYQQARREYYATVDGIDRSLRDTIRTIRLNQLNFEVQRAAVFVAITRVDEARENLTKPGGAELGATTARDLVDALSSLLNTQNSFLRVWVNQEALRMVLDLDLGTMQLNSRGLWIDPGPTEATDSQEPEAPDNMPPISVMDAAPLPNEEPLPPSGQ